MTKKHFELIARALAKSRPTGLSIVARNQWEITVKTFGQMCDDLNPSFNHKLFLDAVGWDLPGGGNNE
jgi:hypothetical protein